MSDMALAEARLGSPPSERMIKYHDLPGLEREKKQSKEFIAVDMAHTVMLVEQGIVEPSTGGAIVRQLLLIDSASGDDFPFDVRKGSFLLQMEANLSRAIGEDLAGRMHTGRSRIDQGATVRRLYKRNRMLSVMDRLNELRQAILAKSRQHVHTVMPGYTHMQQAQPWVFGHYLLSFSARLHDSFERLVQTYGRLNRSPLGAVGLAGTSWPLDRTRTQDLLGFDGLIENSKLGREAYYAAELIGALSFVMSDLNDLATDLHIWSSTEFGMVECHDSYCGTSSIFPQKKNPTALETIKKSAGAAVTWLANALATFRAEGTGDQAVRELPVIDEALDATEGMLDLCTGVIETLSVHEDRMRFLLQGSWCTASNLADVIVREKKLPFREVHHVVARLVKNALACRISPETVTGEFVDRAAMETLGRPLGLQDTEVREALDPIHFVRTRVSEGSIAPDQIERLATREAANLARDRQWMEDTHARLEHAAQSLRSAAHELAKRGTQ